MDKDKVLQFMVKAGMKVAIVRSNGHYYFCEKGVEHSAWDGHPGDTLKVVECPAPIEILG